MQKFMTFLTVFMLMFCLSICSVHAEAPDVEELPNVPASQFENAGYVLFYNPSDSGGTTYLYYYNKDVVTEKPFIQWLVGSGSYQANLRFYRSQPAESGVYWLENYTLMTADDGSLYWYKNSQTRSDGNSTQYFNAVLQGDGRYPDSITAEFYYASDGVYFNDYLGLGGGSRDFFQLNHFPMTFWEMVQEAMNNLMMTLRSSVHLSTTLGIGLMACLILVVLLSTKFRQFLR